MSMLVKLMAWQGHDDLKYFGEHSTSRKHAALFFRLLGMLGGILPALCTVFPLS